MRNHTKLRGLLMNEVCGNDPASEKPIPLFYEELHQMEKWHMRQQAGDMFQTTELFRETYLKLAK